MRLVVLAVAFLLASISPATFVRGQSPPPNEPALIRLDGSHVTIRYDGRELLSAELSGTTPVLFQTLVDSAGGALSQVVKLTRPGGTPITLTGTIVGGDEAFPAEADRREDGLALVRHSVGLSRSRLNRAVYDRGRDWTLSVDAPAVVRIIPMSDSVGRRTFRLEVRGEEIGLRFRPRFYQRHRGLRWFEPWTYRVRTDVPVGWSSWYAYRDRVTERDVHDVADVIAARLAPFGIRYLQLDDGYQQQPIGLPEHWLQSNVRFPSGMAELARYIRARGLEPGIWTNVSFHDSAWAEAHPTDFVTTTDGHPAYGNWIGYVMDGSNPDVWRDLMRPVYAGFRGMGYSYFKVDALRHLRYEGFNSNAAWFSARGLDRAAVFRDVVRRIRQEIGPAAFLLACWGVRPELVGLVDAVRIGDDGFGYGGLAQYNSFNNVVWRNDPDHIELGQPDAYAATLATTLTGSHMMLTDRAPLYRTPRAEIARRAAPVPFTLPGQLYDVDPSRSSQLQRAGVELSGAGPRPLDADQAPATDLWLLDLSMPFEQWSVLGRTGGGARRIPLAELGLAGGTTYLVFDFWARRLLGAVRDTLSLGALDSVRHAQALCIRERLPHPQLVATDRHVTCGGPDLHAVAWSGTTLSGESDVVGGDPYTLFVSEPAGFRLRAVTARGATVERRRRAGGLLELQLRAGRSSTAEWRLTFDVAP